MKSIITFVIVLFCSDFSCLANACTISEDELMSVPLNYNGIPNSFRLKIADSVSRARTWPGADIQAQINTSAYIGERNSRRLAISRGREIKRFLIQLGVKEKYIYVDAQVIDRPYPADSTGPGGYKQLRISLSPFCEQGCERLCNDPRVFPTSKAIK